MKKLIYSIAAACSVFMASCGSYEVQCENSQLIPYFKSFQPSEIDTFIIRRFTANTNFSQRIDSSVVVFGRSGYYTNQHDTTIVRPDYAGRIIVGYDWQIYIPARNKTVNITDIKSEQRSQTCNKGIFSMDKVGCACYNSVFSFRQDNQTINPLANMEYVLYIQ